MDAPPILLLHIGELLAGGCLLLVALVASQLAMMLLDVRRQLGLPCSLTSLARAARARGALPLGAFGAMSGLLLATAASCWPMQVHLRDLLADGEHGARNPGPFLAWTALCMALHLASHVAYIFVEKSRLDARAIGRSLAGRERSARLPPRAPGSRRRARDRARHRRDAGGDAPVGSSPLSETARPASSEPPPIA